MPNVKKKPDERRSEYLGVRLVPEQKRKLEKCAKVMGVSVGKLVSEALDEYMKPLGSRKRATWKVIDSACSILEEQEEEQRKWKYR